MIKSREANKFFIKQFVISEEDENPETWSKEFYEGLTKDNAIIGYLYKVTKPTALIAAGKVLNLYLIKREYYDEAEVSRQELVDAWFTFLVKCETSKGHDINVFKNPPAKQWLETKENWCKKLASKIAEQYHWSYDDALSEVYYIVLKCYNKGRVYMGNLGYIQTACTNSVLMSLRYNRNRLNGMNPKVQSFEVPVGEDKDGAVITLGETLGVEDPFYAEHDAAEFREELMQVLRKSFSDREIEQIINQPQKGYLPMQLYRRLLKWRKEHSVKEFLEGAYGKTN